MRLGNVVVSWNRNTLAISEGSDLILVIRCPFAGVFGLKWIATVSADQAARFVICGEFEAGQKIARETHSEGWQ
jgi:hypothetical protein